ncbi:hypothetical protein [Citrobacter freundii]|uniref:hypothetical protein n=1 Tax=Citrobacter freundii TaxID=546 RepID=UPI002245974D|nr:hypothetical protein [Citrobacter freundii]MCX2444549.1 hypothetical protein [Citrobacter freundii]HDS2480275.1 hypothetical protein [Klebsiella pneumoniae]HDT1511543.1 hypothetical protein [Escherichia coli]
MQKSKRRLGFMVGKSNATLPDETTDAAIDEEVTNLFFESLLESAKEAVEIHNGKRPAARRTIFHVNQVTKSVIERSEARTDVFTATDAPDLFKKLKMDRDN